MHVVLWTLLVLFLLSMTVGGLVGGANIIDQLIGNTNPQTTIAKINGEVISPSQFNSIVNQQLAGLRSNGQDGFSNQPGSEPCLGQPLTGYPRFQKYKNWPRKPQTKK